MKTHEILIHFVCPVLGVFISNAMFFSPWSLVMKARRNRHLGTVNPVPYAVMFNTQLGYVIYGAMISNYFIFFSSIFGVLLGLFYCITCLTIMAKESVEDEFSELYLLIEGLLLGGIGVWSFLCILQTSIFNEFPDPQEQGRHMIGVLCAVCLVIYYGSPLSTISEILRTKDSSSLYPPLIIANTLDATLWLTYGAFGIDNFVVWGPSLIGLFLSLIQIALIIIYSKGGWIQVASGLASLRAILMKKKVEDEDMVVDFGDDHTHLSVKTTRSRRKTFVVVPEDEDVDQNTEVHAPWEHRAD